MKIFLLTLLSLPILLLTMLGILGFLPGGDSVVAQRTLPEGTQMEVRQECNGLTYEVGFYIKSPKSDWQHYYLDHEDMAWRDARIEYNEQKCIVTVWKGSKLRGTMTLDSKKWERP